MAGLQQQRKRASASTQPHQPAQRVGAHTSNSSVLDAMHRAQQPTSVAPAATSAPKKTTEYVDMKRGGRGKAHMLRGLYGNNKALLKANGVSSHMESKMAGISMNEGGRNEVRRLLGRGYLRDAKSLKKKLGKQSPATMTDAQLAKLRKKLPEDQQFLLDQSVDGAVDLNGISSKNRDVRDSAREGITNAGVEHRTQQYAEMNGLLEKKKSSKLDKKEARRLKKLQRVRGYSALGMARKYNMGTLAGMSKDRFAEIYAPGQQRFEPNQYRKMSKSYARSQRAHKANPKKKLSMKGSIGTFGVTPEMETSLSWNNDLIADMATSYGTSQIMGAYAVDGSLHGVDAGGNKANIGIDELKQSRDRLSPNADDMRHQMAFLRMKGIDLGSTTMSNDALAGKYQGSRKGAAKRRSYAKDLKNNSARFLNPDSPRRRKKAPHKKKKKKKAPHRRRTLHRGRHR